MWGVNLSCRCWESILWLAVYSTYKLNIMIKANFTFCNLVWCSATYCCTPVCRQLLIHSHLSKFKARSNWSLSRGKILHCFACIPVHINEGWMIQDHIADAMFPTKDLLSLSLSLSDLMLHPSNRHLCMFIIMVLYRGIVWPQNFPRPTPNFYCYSALLGFAVQSVI